MYLQVEMRFGKYILRYLSMLHYGNAPYCRKVLSKILN